MALAPAATGAAAPGGGLAHPESEALRSGFAELFDRVEAELVRKGTSWSVKGRPATIDDYVEQLIKAYPDLYRLPPATCWRSSWV